MSRLLLFLISALLVFIQINAQGALRHRYSFTNVDTTAVDSVGGQHGTLEGTASISGNAVQLDGSSGYVNLPPDLITGYTALTFEAWFIFASDSETWSRVWDFGDTNLGSGYGRDYVFFTPRSNAGTFRYAISDADPRFDNEDIIETAPTPAEVPVHVAVVHNGFSVSLYVSGSPAATAAFTIPLSAVDNDFSYLGKSLYDDDPLLKGSIDEFRIYDDALD